MQDSTGSKRPYTGRNAPSTSYEAAEIIAPNVDTLRARVLDWAERQAHGFTHEELADAFSYHKPNSVFPRCTELAEEGKVLNTGMRRYNRAGNSCTVWIATSLTGREVKPLAKKPTTKELMDRIETLERELKLANELLAQQAEQLRNCA